MVNNRIRERTKQRPSSICPRWGHRIAWLGKAPLNLKLDLVRAKVKGFYRKILTGAQYGGLPQKTSNNSPFLNVLENPKSASLTCQFESNNKFSTLTSR